LHALLTLLYFGMLAYCTDKLAVERCLPAESWSVTVAMNVSENMHIVKVDIHRSIPILQHRRLMDPVVDSPLP